MNDELGIQVNIAGKYYKLRCKRSEESLFRKAAKQINDKVLQYQGTFPSVGLELKDFLSMVALQLSFDNLKRESAEDVSPVFEKMDKIRLELDDFLKSN